MRKLIAITLTCGLLAAFLAPIAQAERPKRPDGPPRERPDGPPPRRGGEGEHRPSHGPPPLVKALDTNGDHVLDAKEIANASEALLTLDKNKDGKLSPDELFGKRGPRDREQGDRGPGDRKKGKGKGKGKMSPEDRFKKMDKNGDGKISKEEVPERIREKIFERMDGDSNDEISKDEYVDFLKKRMKKRGERPDGPPRNKDGRPKKTDSEK